MPLRLIVVIQARTGSTRLPGKVLRPLGGRSVLTRMIERVRAATTASEVVVATTTYADDDEIARICRQEDVPCFRGHPTDLLERHYRAGIAWRADAVVKIPSDCPLIDPQVIDRVLCYYLAHCEQLDYVSNLHPATYPDGNDVEVVSMDALEVAWKEARRAFEREHTTPYLWENPGRFHLGNVTWETGLDYSMTHRWVLDYLEDYRLMAAIFDTLYERKPLFGLADILYLLELRPELRQLNQQHLGVNWYRHHWHELKTIRPEQTRV